MGKSFLLVFTHGPRRARPTYQEEADFVAIAQEADQRERAAGGGVRAATGSAATAIVAGNAQRLPRILERARLMPTRGFCLIPRGRQGGGVCEAGALFEQRGGRNELEGPS